MARARYFVAALVGIYAVWLAYLSVGLFAPVVQLGLRFKRLAPLEVLGTPIGIASLLAIAAAVQLVAGLRLARQQDQVLTIWLIGLVINVGAIVWLWLAAMAAQEQMAEAMSHARDMGISVPDLQPPTPRHYLGLAYPAVLTVLVWWADRRRSA